jgi:hypothetical protein
LITFLNNVIMKQIFFFLTMIATTQMFAQSPRVQVIHNSPDAAAATVDIWINGAKAVEDLDFREATPFVTLNSGTTNVGIAPGNSTTINDTIANFTFNLMMNTTYVVVADGTLSGSPSYSPFQPFGLNVYAMGRETATNAQNVDVLIHHGSTDAPTVDVRGKNPADVLLNDAPYGAFGGYLSLPTDNYIVRITDATGSTIVQSYSAPLSSLNLGGQAVTVVASGFLNPAANSNGPAFGLYAALASGGALVALPIAPDPRVQVIHNSADAAAAAVDVWVNGAKAIDDFAFRTSSPFISLPAGNVNVGIAPGNSSAISDTIANFTFNLLAGNTYVAIAEGIVSPSGYNPATPFGIAVYDDARETASNSNNVDVLVHHGATDAPVVDVRGADTTTVLVNDAAYGDFAGYLSLPEGDYTIRITDATGSTVVQSYQAPLATLNLGGNAISVVASGFLNPANNSNGPSFGLWVALASGGALVELPLAVTALNQIESVATDLMVYPNPVKSVFNLSWTQLTNSEISVRLTNIQGQTVRNYNLGNIVSGAQNMTLDTDGLANGWYNLSIVSASSVQTLKVLINK